MNNSITLKEAIDLKRTYGRPLSHAEQLGTECLTAELTTQFLVDNKSSRSGKYRHERFLAHNRCIRFLESYLETRKVSIKKFHEPVGEAISDGFAEALILYDQAEEASGLSQASLIKNRRPIQYLLEYMTALGYQKLSDIKPGRYHQSNRGHAG